MSVLCSLLVSASPSGKSYLQVIAGVPLSISECRVVVLEYIILYIGFYFLGRFVKLGLDLI